MLETTVLDQIQQHLVPNSLVVVTKSKLPQAFDKPERVLWSEQWFLFLKSGQVYFPDWLCLLIASIALTCGLLSLGQQMPVRDATTPNLPIQPYNPKHLP